MNRLIAAPVAGALLAAGVFAAQAQTVVIQPQEQTVIHKYVVEHQAAPVELPQGTTIEVGTPIPDSVELQTIDAPDLPTQYEYVVVNGQTVIVDPQSRKIVQIMQ